MGWLIALNILMYVGAAVLYFNGLGLFALICFILSALLTLGLSGGKLDLFDLL